MTRKSRFRFQFGLKLFFSTDVMMRNRLRCFPKQTVSQKVIGMAQQKGRYPRRGGVVQAEAYMWYALH